ncbi:hypothetical protein CMEL01_06353 [Colletotrichum melonis]|uniref:Tat pathway signal sequence n=1 Tax=Colletotrichum melonis TaxID=1209925 RepID=A0AAI9XKX9_9PEZI|nr:hypothetical protein CMEL01_06353 [Colletotrichum melonis]
MTTQDMSTTPAVKYKPVSDDGFEDVKTDDDHEEYPLDQRKWNSCRGTSKSRRALQILASLLILAIYTWAVLYYAREVIYKPFCPRLTTPDTVHVWDKVEFNPQPVNPVTPGHDHPLLGNPSPEVDANWSALLSGKPFVSVDVEPRHRFTNQSQRLPTESRNPRYTDLAWRQMRYLSTMEKAASNLGGLAMVHNLHCINYLYQVAHREYYYTPNTTEKEDATQKSHIADSDFASGHCLHHIMESVKCQADLTPVLLHWTLHDFHSVINWDGVERTCADWSQLMDWGSEHSVRKSTSISQFTDTKHPIYGNFLDEHGKFSWVDQEGGVDYKEFFKTPEYQKWAKEQGLASGEAAAEEYLRSFYVKQ